MRVLVVSVLLVFGFPVTMNEVVDSFKTCSQFFLDDKPPVISGVLKNSVSQDNNRYKIICQKYRNKYRFATLYDTNKKIPVFSAYRYTGSSAEQTNSTLMIEPQLEVLDAEMRKPCVHQADNGDYNYYLTKKNVARGHLFPSSYTVDEDTGKSTFTLTNAVPQHHSFNNASWEVMEQKVRHTMDYHCRDQNNADQTSAFVLTGAVASQENVPDETVNIPTHMWTVFCCYNHERNTWVSQAHWAENRQNNTEAINSTTLEQLQVFLQGKYGPESTLFNNICLDFLNAT